MNRKCLFTWHMSVQSWYGEFENGVNYCLIRLISDNSWVISRFMNRKCLFTCHMPIQSGYGEFENDVKYCLISLICLNSTNEWLICHFSPKPAYHFCLKLSKMAKGNKGNIWAASHLSIKIIV